MFKRLQHYIFISLGDRNEMFNTISKYFTPLPTDILTQEYMQTWEFISAQSNIKLYNQNIIDWRSNIESTVIILNNE